MVKPPTFDSNGMKKGAWGKEEDEILRAFVLEFGHHNWRRLPLLAGLARCGKSCRLRWMNYLKPGLKRGKITKHEEDLIIKLHHQLGRKWSAIAAKLPGRTDNEVKNYWHAHIKKRAIKLENESSSSEISSCHLQEENVDVHSVARDGDHVLTELANLPQFDADFRLFQEMQYVHTQTFASSSDSGTSDGDCFWSEPFGDDILDMVLW